MARTSHSIAALCFAVLVGCGSDPGPGIPDDLPEEPPPGVPAERLRLQRLRDLGGNDWKSDWLQEEGWEFWGYEIEAGSDAAIELGWNEARRKGSLAKISLQLKPHKPVRIIFGIQARIPIFGPIAATCPNCGRERTLSGSVQPTYTCRKCEKPFPVAPESVDLHTRTFRILVLGGEKVRGRSLKARGPLIRFDSPNRMVFEGKIDVEDLIDPTTATDVIYSMRSHAGLFLKGESHIALMVPLDPDGDGGGSSFSSHNGNIEFEHTGGRTRVSGTNTTFQLHVDNKVVEVADYPFPIWEFLLTFK